MTAEKKVAQKQVTAPNFQTAQFRIIGTTPMVQNKFPEEVFHGGYLTTRRRRVASKQKRVDKA